MIKVTIENGLNFVAYLDDVVKKLDVAELNHARGNSFSAFVKKNIKSNNLGLAPLSEATIKMQGAHSPMLDTGDMLRALEVKRSKQYTDVGYFAVGLGAKTASGSVYSKKKLRIYQVAALHHNRSGYRIPVLDSVRSHLNKRGIGLSKGKAFIYVKSRPFLWKAVEKYFRGNHDQKIIEDFLEKAL